MVYHDSSTSPHDISWVPAYGMRVGRRALEGHPMDGCVIATAVLGALAALVIPAVLAVLALRQGREVQRGLRVLDQRVGGLEARVIALLRSARQGEPRPDAAAGAAEAASVAAKDEAAPRVPPMARPPVLIPAPPPGPVPTTAQSTPAPPPESPAVPGTKPRFPALDGTLEARIGGRWFLYIGASVLLLGIGFFVKYAFDNHWINETARVLTGAAAGLGLIALGHGFVRRDYGLYGQILTGSGFVALFISIYAAYAFYGLIPQAPAFLLFAATAAAAAVAADVQASQGLAFMAVVGGFLTPFLVSTGRDAQVTLFTYDAILVAGTMYLARRRSWPLLNLASFALTCATFEGWAVAHYAPAKYLPTEAFLTLFCAMFLYVLRENWRRDTPAARAVGLVLCAGPILYHAASLANLNGHSLAALIYLTLFSMAAVAAGARLDRSWVRLVAWVTGFAPFLWWLSSHARPGWYVAGLVVLAAIYAMHLLAQIERLGRRPDGTDGAEILVFHLNGLGLFAGLYILVDSVAPYRTGLLASGLAMWSLGLAASSRRFGSEAPAQGLALAFAMAGFAIGFELDDWWAAVGWAAEATAVIWTGLAIRRNWMRLGGALLMVCALTLLLNQGFFTTPAGFTAVINARVGSTLAIVAMWYLLAIVHRRSGARLPGQAAREIALLTVAANVLTLALVTVEISSYFEVRAHEQATADLARGMSLSLAWGLYGVALVVAGILWRYRPIRYLAIALLALTVGKVLLVDLSGLGGVYRILGFVGLGVFLLVGSYLYQRFRAVIAGDEAQGVGRSPEL